MKRFLPTLMTLSLAGCGGSSSAPEIWPDTLTVENPQTLPSSLPAMRIPLGVSGESKPNVILLGNGDTLLVDYASQQSPYQENLCLYRSSDNGKTWGERFQGPMGREGYLSQTRSGVLFVTAQVLQADARNTQGYAYNVLYRSADGGVTWDAGTPVLHADVGGEYATDAGRNVLELPDGSLMWVVGADYVGKQFIWRSYDAGLTWAKSGVGQDAPAGFDPIPTYGQWSDETVLAMDGMDVVAYVRCFPGALPEIPNDTLPSDSPVNDQDNRLVIFRSHDNGETWTLDNTMPFRYGEMYPSTIGDMFTFTIRALQPVVGVRVATHGASDLTHDVVVISSEANDGKEDPAGGGYGNTIKLPDGAYLTPYSYRDTSGNYFVESVRWEAPK